MSVLSRRDLLLLVGFSLCLFGVTLVGGRALTMHESVLPQSAREMLARGDWLIPTSGGRPWLERPPLPQWVTLGVASLVGRCDAVWIVRIGPVLAGMAVVLLTAVLAARSFGRPAGVLAGLIVATSFEFTRYAWLAEEDVFLAALVSLSLLLFARLVIAEAEEGASVAGPGSAWGVFDALLGRRSWCWYAAFLALGTTNLVKGMLFGPAMVLVPAVGFLVLARRWHTLVRFVWLPGCLLAVTVAVAWPALVIQRFPDVLELWAYDDVGRLTGAYHEINEPAWYYLVTLPWLVLPWTPACIAGLVATWPKVRRAPGGALGFVWCWAILPPVVLSLAAGKHHHYLVSCLPAWAILATFGLEGCRAAIGKLLRRPVPESQRLGRAVFGCLLLLYVGGHVVTGQWLDKSRHDVRFLTDLRTEREGGTRAVPLAVNADLEPLTLFQSLFYLDDGAVPLHNLSFLRDTRLDVRAIDVVTRAGDAAELATFGSVTVRSQSFHSRQEKTPADRLTCFRLRFDPALRRLPGDVPISPMQAMHRADGPWLR